ncbi:NAD(P)H-dependent oxidoreductase [Metabacillus herbersteinensis]|uniref:NAD(P)H-dependent oxidoreductase n=1 Tax=Metabacillus herbersteinensis TaxID=283816 RepID=A0ABV6GER6_9BACI
MNTLIIYAHPSKESFNSSIKDQVIKELQRKKNEIKIRDLYQLNFNPILTEDDFTSFAQNKVPKDVQAEQSAISWANHLVFIYPTWWIGMPAILKGYFDRVFTNGFAFRHSKDGPQGLLNGKKVIIIQTTGQPEQYLKPNQLISAMETSVDVGILDYCGLEILTHKFLYSVPYVDKETREKMLKEVTDLTELL